ncbi:hypothetical protein FSP39_018214 [Pinctada imbricata]|uniref:Uncharacterized protein n=1 Tax=Pinctada imbricata TaxID=66713 RepID=A0AA89C1V8_PINIB|nr:hypothetical protein FSP39_018214 [Pinctada imbricata]
MRQQTDTVTYSIFGTDAQVVDFGSKTVLTRITVTSNDGCHLSFRYSQGCNQTGGTDPVLTDAENITVLTNITTYVGYLAVKCIEMTNIVAGSFCRVFIETQTGSPSFAPVIAVSAFWQNEICQFANIMMPDLMTSSNVQLYHGEIGDTSSRYAALRHTGTGLGLKLGSWPVPDTRIFVRPADQYNDSILLQRIEITTNVTSICVKAVLCNSTNNIENSTLSFREEIENGAVTIWMSNDSTPLCILQVEISLPTLTSNDTSLKRSLRMGLFGCVNNSDTTCSIVDLFKEEYFPSNKITLYSEQEGTDMTSIGTCGEGLQIPVYDVLENPVFYIKLTQSPQIFVLVDRIMLLGASLTAYVSAAKRQYGVFEILNTTTFTSGVIAEFQTSIEVHTLQVSASHTDFKMEIWGCILNRDLQPDPVAAPTAKLQNTRCENTKTSILRDEKETYDNINIEHKRLHVNQRDQWATGADFGRPFAKQVSNGMDILDYRAHNLLTSANYPEISKNVQLRCKTTSSLLDDHTQTRPQNA